MGYAAPTPRLESLKAVGIDLDAGLAKATQLAVARGYFQALFGVTSAEGPLVRAEAGWHPLDPLAAFAFGEASRAGSRAGVGVRWNW